MAAGVRVNIVCVSSHHPRFLRAAAHCGVFLGYAESYNRGSVWKCRILDRDGDCATVGIQELEKARADLVGIFRRQAVLEDELDHWSQLRLMDQAVDEIETRLQSGEFLITFFGGIATLLLGVYVGVQSAAIALTILGAIIGVIVLIRSVLIDIQAYDSELFIESPTQEVAVLKGWNEGPMKNRGSFLMVPFAFIGSKSDWAYESVINWLEQRYERKYHGDELGRYSAQD